MSKAITIIGIATLSMVGLAGAAAAHGRGPHGGGPGARLAALDLTPEQRQQIDQVRDAAMQQSQPWHAQAMQKRNELRELWRADRLDKGAIAHKQAELDAIHAKQRDIWTDFRYQVHGLLTAEQRRKWAELGPGRGGWHGRGPRHGGPDGGGFGPGRGWGGGHCPMQSE